jgi:hypothetical protein
MTLKLCTQLGQQLWATWIANSTYTPYGFLQVKGESKVMHDSGPAELAYSYLIEYASGTLLSFQT